MKYITFNSFLLIFSLCIMNSSFIKPQEIEKKFKSVEVPFSEIREVKSNITGKQYELLVGLPYSYYKNITKKYPVVYFCDGFYDFPLLSMIYGEQIYDKTINECILVGFSYKGKNLDYGKLRAYDYTPTKDPTNPIQVGGGAKDFLDVVEKEFIPFVQANYRVDTSFRALGGSSLGGLFTLYSLFSKPYLFSAYIAISPAVNWDNSWLVNFENNFSKKDSSLPVSLYMTGAEHDIPDMPDFLTSIKDFAQTLKSRNYKDFRFHFRLLDGLYHSGSKPEGYSRGIKFIFEPLLK